LNVIEAFPENRGDALVLTAELRSGRMSDLTCEAGNSAFFAAYNPILTVLP
jgi:hypothetical protein